MLADLHELYSRERDILAKLSTEEVREVIRQLDEAREKRQRIFICADGHLTPTVTHLVYLLKRRARAPGKPIFKASSLCENTEFLTDEELAPDNTFVGAMEGEVEKGDVLIAISRDGNSTSILNAVSYAKNSGATTIGISGFDGGKLKDSVDLCLTLPSSDTELVERVLFPHLCNLIVHSLERKKGEKTKDTTERLEKAVTKYPENWIVVRDKETRGLLKAWDKDTGRLWVRVEDKGWMWID